MPPVRNASCTCCVCGKELFCHKRNYSAHMLSQIMEKKNYKVRAQNKISRDVWMYLIASLNVNTERKGVVPGEPGQLRVKDDQE